MNEQICSGWVRLIRNKSTKAEALRELSRIYGMPQNAVKNVLVTFGVWEVSKFKWNDSEVHFSVKDITNSGQHERNDHDTHKSSFSEKFNKIAMVAIIAAAVLFFVFRETSLSDSGSHDTADVATKTGDTNSYYTDHRNDPRYQQGSEKMQDYVDDEMRKYDEYCARSSDC